MSEPPVSNTEFTQAEAEADAAAIEFAKVVRAKLQDYRSQRAYEQIGRMYVLEKQAKAELRLDKVRFERGYYSPLEYAKVLAAFYRNYTAQFREI